MRVAPEIVAALCRKYAPELLTPAKWQGTRLEPARLLWAIAGVESAFGANCPPRHETGYCYGGRYFDKVRSREWGCLAHCSYGPWQVMYSHFPLGVSPLSLVWDTSSGLAVEVCIRGAIGVLNGGFSRGVGDLTSLVVAYNGPGNVEEYSRRLADALQVDMPGVAGAVKV